MKKHTIYISKHDGGYQFSREPSKKDVIIARGIDGPINLDPNGFIDTGCILCCEGGCQYSVHPTIILGYLTGRIRPSVCNYCGDQAISLVNTKWRFI